MTAHRSARSKAPLVVAGVDNRRPEHEFLSPLSNQRTDEYGGAFDNRVRLLLDVVEAVRTAVLQKTPEVVRISGTDWVEGGWDADDAVRLAGPLRDAGVDLLDVSTGGNAPVDIPVGPGYQVEFARRIRQETGIATGAVGLITEPKQAQEIVADGSRGRGAAGTRPAARPALRVADRPRARRPPR